MEIFESYESIVRSYCRQYTDVFYKAKNEFIYSEEGKEYIDFLAGAGALNYGHNNEYIKKYLLDYIEKDGITHGLDMYTNAKRNFINEFVENILKPKNLDYKIQFCGPTGTNAVEAALKLARKVKKRSNIFAFMGGFHGMSLGSLATTSNLSSREGAGMSLSNVTFMPFPNGSLNIDTLDYIEKILEDDHSGIEKPAAIILETIQAEGGINVASNDWLQGLASICKKHDILLICDDIQVGCGRTGDFFSFERANIVPDIVILSKSISGYGLPMSLLLMNPKLDIWKPGEHNGTFRGNQLAFVASVASLRLRENLDLDNSVRSKASYIKDFLETQICTIDSRIEIRGMGMIWGIDLNKLEDSSIYTKIIKECFNRGLIIEKAGRNSSVIKLLPPLTITEENLRAGLGILEEVLLEILPYKPLLQENSFV
ncbi:diaminobutyrate--2-oxoglutarate transaminase [Lysinibacillus sp. NPDC097287]|uniref:diaminobutyrate--2-oxoglutarate transaminase n=1 Tax=Lysinibacillus sp. NPDC097287 TaxID=3364144 RepID=UPI003825D6AA